MASAAPSGPLRPCQPSTPEHAEATAALEKVEQLIQQLTPAAPPTALDDANQSLDRLLGSRCFAMSEENPRGHRARSVASLQAFWRDGGAQWVRSYLLLREARTVVVPPDVRPEVSVEEPAKGVPQLLLCPRADASCGAETRGWQARAVQAFRHHALDAGELAPRHGAEPVDVAASCGRKARKMAPAQRYQQWRECVEDGREQIAALPLGGSRAPRAGWWLIRGRRGHHSACDGVWLYDLATGAVFVAERCSKQVPKNGERLVVVRAGRVSREALLEAVWMAALAPQAHRVQSSAVVHDLPVGIDPAWPAGLRSSLKGTGGWGSSAQTRLAWSWFDGPAVLAEGTITWPESASAGDTHAANLVRVVEAGLVEGCAPARLPELPAALRPTDPTLLDALRAAPPPPDCPR